MVELISIHDRTDFKSTKATEVTLTPKAISRAGSREALLQLCVLNSVALAFHKLPKSCPQFLKKLLQRCSKQIKKKI